MKNLALALLLGSLPHGAERAPHWICEVEGTGPQKSALNISLPEPLITFVSYEEEGDGKYREQIEELVTIDALTQWRAPKKDCMIDAESRENEATDSYSYDFNCPGIVGNFSMNFKERTGLYVETRPADDMKRAIPLENCRISKP